MKVKNHVIPLSLYEFTRHNTKSRHAHSPLHFQSSSNPLSSCHKIFTIANLLKGPKLPTIKFYFRVKRLEVFSSSLRKSHPLLEN